MTDNTSEDNGERYIAIIEPRRVQDEQQGTSTENDRMSDGFKAFHWDLDTFNTKGDGVFKEFVSPLSFLDHPPEPSQLIPIDIGILQGKLNNVLKSHKFEALVKSLSTKTDEGRKGGCKYLNATYIAILMNAIHKTAFSSTKTQIMNDLELLRKEFNRQQNEQDATLDNQQAGGSSQYIHHTGASTLFHGGSNEGRNEDEENESEICNNGTCNTQNGALHTEEYNHAKSALKLISLHMYQIDKWPRIWEMLRQYATGGMRIGMLVNKLRYYAAIDFNNFSVAVLRHCKELKKNQDATQDMAQRQEVVDEALTNCGELVIQYFGWTLAHDQLNYINDNDQLRLFMSPHSCNIGLATVDKKQFGSALLEMIKLTHEMLDYKPPPRKETMTVLQPEAAEENDRNRRIVTRDGQMMLRGMMENMPRMMADLEQLMANLIASGKKTNQKGIILRLRQILTELGFDSSAIHYDAELDKLYVLTLDITQDLLASYFPIHEIRSTVQKNETPTLHVGNLQMSVAGSVAAITYTGRYVHSHHLHNETSAFHVANWSAVDFI